MKETSHTSYHTPLLLAWFILRYMLSGDDEDIGGSTARLLGNIALQCNVFEVIVETLRSPFFTGERVCNCILYMCNTVCVYIHVHVCMCVLYS